ncbi:MAG: hypothetical protein C3F02_01665 [Parcubacteria group bacterium]|nr:MAG: hypothetical protein C3F02_01665 [Parcubacteria group bacterium]
MYLERLEIQGFKSFARPVELAFNRELTSIVGPNGSGKSNIADAVRWVLGEQSIKTLRGKKSEDVIFAGSDQKARLGFAQVDLYLNNIDKLADVDYEQIVVTRKINRSGESEYLINNNKVRLLDVQLLLAKANFGQKTYSVIGQGMIDSILTSSSAERKEFFDEATGVKQFQIKKEQSVSKLEHSKENLLQTEQILTELEPRLRSLTRQVKRLERRDKIETELRQLQTDYYSFLSNNLTYDIGLSRARHSKLKEELADLNQKLVSLQTQLDKEEKSSSRQDNFSLLQAKLSQSQKELNAFIKEKTILEGRADLKLVAEGKSDIVWLKKQIENVKTDIGKYQLQLEEKNQVLKTASSELVILEERRRKILEEFEALEKLLSDDETDFSVAEISQSIDTLLKKQKSFQDILTNLASLEGLPRLRETCGQITAELDTLGDKLHRSKHKDKIAWQKEFNTLLMAKDNLVSEISEARTQVAILQSESQQIQNNIDKEKDELNKLSVNLEHDTTQSGFREQLGGINHQIKVHTAELAKIEKEIQDFNEVEQNKKSALMEAQRKFRELQQDFNTKNNALNEVKVELARLETRQEDLAKEIAEEIPNLLIKEGAQVLDSGQAKEKINSLKDQLHIIGGIDQAVVVEYQEVDERYSFLRSQSDDLHQAIEHLEKIIKDLDESIAGQFDSAFKNINKLFDKYFKKLFSGGKAELILNIIENREELEPEGVMAGGEAEDDEEEKEENNAKKEVKITRSYGIDIKATPPGKRLSSINMLSGGEKALTSIALICAIIANNPSPFVVLDEVDAALDEANSVRFGEILDELSSKTQFIAITHNRATMHKAKIIYGVTMGSDGVSELLSVSFAKAEEIAQ